MQRKENGKIKTEEKGENSGVQGTAGEEKVSYGALIPGKGLFNRKKRAAEDKIQKKEVVRKGGAKKEGNSTTNQNEGVDRRGTRT